MVEHYSHKENDMPKINRFGVTVPWRLWLVVGYRAAVVLLALAAAAFWKQVDTKIKAEVPAAVRAACPDLIKPQIDASLNAHFREFETRITDIVRPTITDAITVHAATSDAALLAIRRDFEKQFVSKEDYKELLIEVKAMNRTLASIDKQMALLNQQVNRSAP